MAKRDKNFNQIGGHTEFGPFGPQSVPNQPGMSFPSTAQTLDLPSGGAARPTPSQLPTQTPQESATTVAQKAAGQAFIQQREKLTSRLMEAGVTGNVEHARALASGQIAGLAQENINPSFAQIGAGELGMARERAKAEISGLGAGVSTEPAPTGIKSATGQELTQSQIESARALTGIAASLAVSLISRGLGLTRATRGLASLIGVGAITGNERQRVSEANNLFSNSKSLIDATITSMEAGLVDWDDGMRIINGQIENINRQERFLKTMSQDSVIASLSGGRKGLADVQAWRTEFINLTSPRLQNLGIMNQRQAFPQ